MAEKNTLAILESIKKKIQKLDEPKKSESKDFSDIGDEFNYVSPAKKNVPAPVAPVAVVEEAKPTPTKEDEAIEREIGASFEFADEEMHQQEEASSADSDSSGAVELDFDFDEDLVDEATPQQAVMPVAPQATESHEEMHEEMPEEPVEELHEEEHPEEIYEEESHEEMHDELLDENHEEIAEEHHEEEMHEADNAELREEHDFLEEESHEISHEENELPNFDEEEPMENHEEISHEETLEPHEEAVHEEMHEELLDENHEETAEENHEESSKKSDEDELEELLRQEDAAKIKTSKTVYTAPVPAAPILETRSAPVMPSAAMSAPQANSSANSGVAIDSTKKTFNNVADFLSHDHQESLLNQKTAANITDSIKKLVDAKNVVSGVTSFSKSEAFADIAAQLMEPRLEKWLNENLPSLVEKIVRDEIKKIIPKE